MPGLTVYCMNAFLLSVVATIVMVKVAPRIGLVDVPTARKSHDGRVPLVGSGMFLAFSIASLSLQELPEGFTLLLIGMALIVLLGVIDDILDLQAFFKLAAQCAIVGLVVLPNGLLIRNMGALLSAQPILLLQWAAPATIFAIVGMINALNLTDGLDGLAGGVSLVALIWFALAAALLGASNELPLLLVLSSSILGFLIFNFRHPWRSRAAAFLGDGGSMMLGLALAFVAISLTQRSGPALPPVTAIWICSLPVIDTLSLIFRRLAAGENVFSGDRRHLHHLLLETGLSVSQAVHVLIAASVALGGFGIVGWLFQVPDRVMLLGLVVPFALHGWFTLYGWKHLHLSRAGFAVTGGAFPPWGGQQ
jgi:UDP-GlcNAc:undecaprenyl-phosphate/decaprenyl-phosphate GlcNAc-1-phosphate transferase